LQALWILMCTIKLTFEPLGIGVLYHQWIISEKTEGKIETIK